MRRKMTHQRIRPFNTKQTYPEQNLDNDLCQAVVTCGGKTVWIRGQCPQNLDDAKNIESLDPSMQTHKVMQNIRQLIIESGGEMEHLVKARCLYYRYQDTVRQFIVLWVIISKGCIQYALASLFRLLLVLNGLLRLTLPLLFQAQIRL
jgi:enamine deaminase RidA (YjgF/YER057c/UK114 family)